MKEILVPTDFSDCANNAVDFAVQSAKILPVEVTLVHAFELEGDIYTDYMGVNKEFNQTLLHELRTRLSDLKSSILQKEGVGVHTFVSTFTLKESIFQVASDKNIDMVIMGTSGANGLKEKLWGSKTADIIGGSKVPVLAIPVDYKWKKPQKILLTTNHFEKDPAMLDFIFELADLYLAQVHIAVFTKEEDEALTFLEHSRSIPQYEAMLKEQYRENSLTVTHLFGDDFEKALQDHIQENEIDMVAMVTYKRKFPDNLFRPSMTKQWAYHTKIPLLAIPVKPE